MGCGIWDLGLWDVGYGIRDCGVWDCSRFGNSGSGIVFNASGWEPSAPDIEINTELARGKIPPHLAELFFGEPEYKKQPHLQWLRDLIASGQIEDPQIKVMELEAQRERERKNKDPHQLLSDAEKKANHIASEQKRRANIKKGYEGLAELVPVLREAKEKGENDDDNESENEDSDEEAAGSKKKKGGKEDKDGGKSGPRSEAVVLHKSKLHLLFLCALV